MNKTILLILPGLIFLSMASFSQPCDPPEITQIYSNGGNVIIDFQASLTPTLLGFNFYRDNEFLEYQPQAGDSVYTHYFTAQPPGIHDYCITSACESAIDMLRGDTTESAVVCESVECIYGFDLPFEENWGPGSFSLNDWEISSDNWLISADTGNSPPAALFEPIDQMTDYEETLESYYLNAYGMTEGKIYLAYDIHLSSAQNSGTEHFLVQVWNHESEMYDTVLEYNNLQGSFGWHRDTINIKAFSMGKVFRIRFVATGENSSYINYWGIDNISIYRKCDIPEGTLESNLVNDTCIELEFIPNSQRELVDITTYVQKDDVIIAIYSNWFPMPNPYCVSEPGEYCFFMSYLWASESDMCESEFTGPTCQQVIINKLENKKSSRVSFFYDSMNEIIHVESIESVDKIDVFDLSGRLVDFKVPGSTSCTLDVSHMIPGFYLARMTGQRQTVTRKFIVN